MWEREADLTEIFKLHHQRSAKINIWIQEKCLSNQSHELSWNKNVYLVDLTNAEEGDITKCLQLY